MRTQYDDPQGHSKSEVKIEDVENTTCPQKNLTVCFLALSQLLLRQIQKVRSVLKSAGSEDFKTVLTFDI